MTLASSGGRIRFRVESSCEMLPWLLSLPLGLSRKQAKDLLRFRSIRVQNHASVRHDTVLQAGDVVTITRGQQPCDQAFQRFGLKVIHLDDAIVVVDKPSGLLSMGAAREQQRTAHRILNDYLKVLAKSPRQQAFIVHRLDRETSGLMLFARSPSIQAALQDNWTQVTKKYFAIVEGKPPTSEGTLTDRLVEGKSLLVRRVNRGGNLAITHFRVIDQQGGVSLVELTLATGRKHQIRVQLAGLGCPVAGDRKYGAKTDPARRLALHSCAITFRHPLSDEPMEFRSALPVRLRQLLKRLREMWQPLDR
jgi:23S rRNA pseudouridine1911/1915/1917 synthase